jgi:hypothetical protein
MTATVPQHSVVPVYEDPSGGFYNYLCERCGQPLAGPHDLCHSALHVGSDGLGVGHAVRSPDLARLAGAARAALGGPGERAAAAETGPGGVHGHFGRAAARPGVA